MATTETFVPGRLPEMPLADHQPDPNQPRKYIDPAAFEELTESIQQQGVVAPCSTCYGDWSARICVTPFQKG